MKKIWDIFPVVLVVGIIVTIVGITIYQDFASAKVIDGTIQGVDYTVDGAFVVAFEDGRIFYLTGPLRGAPFVKGKRNVISINRCGRILSMRVPEEGRP